MDRECGPGAPEAPGDWLRAVIPGRGGQTSGQGRGPGCLLDPLSLCVELQGCLSWDKKASSVLGQPPGCSSPVSPSPFSPTHAGALETQR